MTLFQSWVFLWQCLSQGGGGGTPIFSYIHRFWTLYWVQNYSIMKILGYEEIVDFFLGGGGHYKIGLFWWAISIHFRAF